ncbi:MAG: putative selenium-dependent hydroxylase accessory protein YqeC [Anaerolineales bacterium]|nr:putative selenium-dependent hydroxylase accessory protein YqeC [Anaerolineales bacterium]
MDLLTALQLGAVPRVAFVGAGGKTTAMFQLARQLAGPVLVTATTHLALDQLGLADRHFEVHTPTEVRTHAGELSGVTLFSGPPRDDARVSGLDVDTVNEVFRLAKERQLPLLLEADGSRRLPLKAPAAHEPPIPEFVDTVVVVVGLLGLGKPLNAGYVFRPELFGALAGINPDAIMDSTALVKVLASPEGGLKNIPVTARKAALLNQADTPELAAQASRIAHSLERIYQSVLVAALTPPDGSPGGVKAVHQPIAGIVLAAGGSVRLGEAKQLLEWRGKSFIRSVTETALQAGLSPVVVVVGAYVEEIKPEIADLDVEIVYNLDWEVGQSSSVKAGLAALPERSGGAVFLLVDQPQIPPALVRTLVARHAATLAPIIVPEVDGRRGNPVLFDRVTFPNFATLEGDVGGRAVFKKHPLEYVPWVDPVVGLDVDTLLDYQKLIQYED